VTARESVEFPPAWQGDKIPDLTNSSLFGSLDRPSRLQPQQGTNMPFARRTRIIGTLALGLALASNAMPAAADAQETKPPATTVPLDRDVPRHQAINERARQGDVDLLFIGDSITEGWEGAGKEVWNQRYLPRKAMNAGIGGDLTQHVLWRLDHGNIDGLSPRLVVLMIGTNNFGADSPKDIAAGIQAIVEKLRMKLPSTKVLLLGVFPRGETPGDPLREKNVAVNGLVKKLGDEKMVHFLEINAKLLNSDGTQDREKMPDLVHLSPKGYEIWADAIEPTVADLLDETGVAFPELPKGSGTISKDAPRKFTATPSGLKYRILRKGEGAAPKGTSSVKVNYHGWLDDGKVFDSSYKRGQPISFRLNQVIKGWTEGMQLVSPGGMIELEIPAALGYGERGAGTAIGPNATLHFLVELLEVN